MKSLARRGFDYSNREGCSDSFKAGLEKGYWDGATEQHQIDIEKAAEWLSDNINEYVDFDHLNGIQIDYGQLDKVFRKAMEL